jgi:hypothetical protein
MDPQQFEDIADELLLLQKSMRNIMDIVVATSPLLALSTHGWYPKSILIHSTYLLRVRANSIFSILFINNLQEDLLGIG